MDIGFVLGMFIGWPFLALIPFAAFAWLFYRRRRSVILVASVSWLVYFPYELGMKIRLLCSGECNIRIDLLLFYPILLLISVLAIVAYFKSSQIQK